MIVRIVRPWCGRKIGTELDSLGLGVAKTLIERGFAQEVKQVPAIAAEPRRKVKAPAPVANLPAQ